jgi:hypothetical protein
MVECTDASANPAQSCRWCGGLHGVQCPSVKAIEYHQDGSVKRVEFKSASDYAPWPPNFLIGAQPVYIPPVIPVLKNDPPQPGDFVC